MTVLEKVDQALPHWDLSNVYPGLDSAEFARDVEALGRALDELDAYLDAHHIARTAANGGGAIPLLEPAALKTAVEGYLERTNAVLDLYGKLGAYTRSFVTTD